METRIENRRFLRMPFKQGVKFKVRTEESFVGELAQDLSQGGIRILSNVFIGVGEHVNVAIQCGHRNVVVEIAGRVVWVRVQPHSEMYQLGIEFASEEFFSRGRISEFVHSL